MNYFNESGSLESEIKKTYDKTSIGDYQNKDMMDNKEYMSTCCGMPIYECPKERVVNRYICHEVPQD